MDEEVQIFEKMANILQKMILSLTGIYPLDLRSWNSNDYKSEEYSVFFYKKIGECNSKNFEVEWHCTSENERKFAFSWVKRTLYTIIDYFNTNFFKQANFKIYDYNQDFGKIVDKINLKLNEASQTLKNEIWRLFIIIDQILGAINMRVSQEYDKTNEENKIYENFKQNFLFEEYYDLHKLLIEFCKNCFSFFFGQQFN